MKRIYLIIAILITATYQQAKAEGCVAIKGIGGIYNSFIIAIRTISLKPDPSFLRGVYLTTFNSNC